MNSTISNRLPTFFLGHGNPMNVLKNNRYTQFLKNLALELPLPKAILSISAHWETKGSWIQASTFPKQIYDFGGFPDELYKIEYAAKGSPEIAQNIAKKNQSIQPTESWGIDHGTWCILYHLFPKAQIPVIQLSINQQLSPLQHLDLAKQLSNLPSENILVMASGNIVHNLRTISWEDDAPVESWVVDIERQIINILNETTSLHDKVHKIFSLKNLHLAHPSIEHLIPLIYAMGIANSDRPAKTLIQGIQNSSIAMTSFEFL